MRRCRVCQTSLSQHQTFCSSCGARSMSKSAPIKKGPFQRIKDALKGSFKTEADRHYDQGCNLMRFGGQAAIPEFEYAVDLDPANPLFCTALATAYWDIGKQESMLGSVSDSAFQAFQSAIDLEPTNPRWQHALAGAHKQKVERDIIFSRAAGDDSIPKHVQYHFGEALANYQLALDTDSTFVPAYLDMAEVLNYLGRKSVANDNLQKALAILNRAIDADERDMRSYSERARLFEMMGNVPLAISDLEQEMKLATREWEISGIQRRIDTLKEDNKSGAQNQY